VQLEDDRAVLLVYPLHRDRVRLVDERASEVLEQLLHARLRRLGGLALDLVDGVLGVGGRVLRLGRRGIRLRVDLLSGAGCRLAGGG